MSINNVNNISIGSSGTNVNYSIPRVPTVSENKNRLVHTTPFEPESFFQHGLKLGNTGNINFFVRPYGNEKIPLVMPGNVLCGQYPGYFMQEGKYSTGYAILVDIPHEVFREFRSTRCLERVVPKEYIRGAISRDGTWIENPNYNPDFDFTPKLADPPDFGFTPKPVDPSGLPSYYAYNPMSFPPEDVF